LSALGTVLEAAPDVLNHNVETVPSLYARVRPQADYRRSLEVIGRASRKGFVTKSGLMLGLGEGPHEVRQVMTDLRSMGCDILTVGQYLQPRKDLLPVARFYHPEEFAQLRDTARSLGFVDAAVGPRVRSSYNAAECQSRRERSPSS
jgi:lipoic acid synthetase